MATAAIVKANSLLLSKRNESPHIDLFYNNSVKFSRCFNGRLNTWTLGATSKNKIVAPLIKIGNEIAALTSSEQNLKAEMSDSLHSRSDCILTRCDCFYCSHRNWEIKVDAVGTAFIATLLTAVAVLYMVRKIVEGKKACLFKIKPLFDHLMMKLKQLCGIAPPIDETLKETIETIPERHVENNSNEEDDYHKAVERLIAELEQSNDLIRKHLSVRKSKACLFKIKRLLDHLVMKLKQLYGIVPPVDETLKETIETIPERHVENNSSEEDNNRKTVELLTAELEQSDDLIRKLLLVSKSKIITSNVTDDKSSKFSCQKR